jgi:hypothetical protein
MWIKVQISAKNGYIKNAFKGREDWNWIVTNVI